MSLHNHLVRIVLVAVIFPASTSTAAPHPEPKWVGVKMDLGHNFHTLGEGLVTPHLQWAKPLPGGPIKTLFIVPRTRARDAVELIQRVDMNHGSALIFSAQQFGRSTSLLEITGATEKDLAQRLERELARPLEAIIIGRVHWTTLPEHFRRMILDKLQQGTGLLYVYADDSFKPELPPFEARPADAPPLLANLPLQHIWPFHEKDSPQKSLEQSIELFQIGKGRLGLINWPAPAGARRALTPEATNKIDHEYQMALLTRTLLYVAQRPHRSAKITCQIQDPRAPATATLAVTVPREPCASGLISLDIRVTNDEAVLVSERTLDACPPQDQSQITSPLPPLPAGSYFAAVLVRSQGKIIGSAATHWDIEPPFSIKQITLDHDYLRPGQPATAHFVFRSALPEALTLRAPVRDNFDRVVAIGSVQLSPDRASGTVNFSVRPPLTVLHTLDLEGWQSNALAVRHRTEFPVPIAGKSDNFSFFGWGGGSSQDVYSSLLAERLQAAGMDAFHVGTGAKALRDTWKVNARRTQYIWRTSAQYKPEWNGVRQPCLTDPLYLDEVRQKLLPEAEAGIRYGLPAYGLGDECYYMLLDPRHGDSVCYSPTCQAGFKRYLQGMYGHGNVDALNRSWKTDFADWDTFRVASANDLALGAPASRGDHWLYTTKVFADVQEFAVNCIHEKDPGALIGIEGLGMGGADRGIDYYRLCQIFGMLNVYHGGYDVHCLRSFGHQDMIRGMWYGGYHTHREEATERFFPWYSLMMGFNSAWWYDAGKPGENYNALAPDYTPIRSFQWTSEEILEIKQGIGKLVMSMPRDNDRIAILFSQRSFHADSLGAKEGLGGGPDHFDLSMNNFIQMVLDLGLQFDLVATEQVEAGELEQRGFKVLILPMCKSLTTKETEAIKTFVRNGGVAITDMFVGVRDEHLVPIPDDLYPLDEVFGVMQKHPNFHQLTVFTGTIQVNGSHDGLSVKADLPHRQTLIMPVTTGVPLGHANLHFRNFVVNRYGKGKTLYLNFPVEGYLRDRHLGHDSSLLKLFRSAMQWAGMTPRVRVTRDGQPLSATEVARFQRGNLNLTMMYRDHQIADQSSPEATIQWPESAHLYDARDQTYHGFADHCRKRLEPGRVAVFARLPYRVKAVQVEAKPKTAFAGQTVDLRLSCLRDSDQTAPHVYHVQVQGPDGRSRDYYTKNVLGEEGAATHAWQTAMDETPGTWIVSATDVVSGHQGQARIQIIDRPDN